MTNHRRIFRALKVAAIAVLAGVAGGAALETAHAQMPNGTGGADLLYDQSAPYVEEYRRQSPESDGEGYDAPWEDAADEEQARARTLRLGVASISPQSVARLEPFRAALEAELGILVQLRVFSTLRRLQRELIAGSVDYAPLSALAYVEGQARCQCLTPLAAAPGRDGGLHYYSVFYVLADSPVVDLEMLRGKRVALAGRHSVAGRLAPLAALREEGVNPATFFAESLMMDSPISAGGALLEGRVDAAVGWTTFTGDPSFGYGEGSLSDLISNKRAAPGSLRVVWRSPAIFRPAHVVRADMPQALKSRILDLLLDLSRISPAAMMAIAPEAGGDFSPVSAGDYQFLRVAAEAHRSLNAGSGMRELSGGLEKTPAAAERK